MPRLPEIPQKEATFHGYCILNTKRFENLQLDNHKCYTNETYQNYESLTSYLYHLPWHKAFNLAEDRGVTYQGIRGCNWKTSQNEPENQFFGLGLTILIFTRLYFRNCFRFIFLKIVRFIISG